MNILVTNDDGIYGDGLLQLVKYLSEIGDVYVVAPAQERSSNSHHLTISGRIKYEYRDVPHAKKAIALWGTPADCVHCGIKRLLDEEIDLVVSGINRGPNLSTDIIYSGTIAAAREAFLDGKAAMAISLCDFHPDSYKVAAIVGRNIAEEYMKLEDRLDYFINVNVPNIALEDIKGIKICDRIAKIDYNDQFGFVKEDGVDYIEIHGAVREIEYDKDDLRIDLSAVEHGYVAISPLYNQHIDEKHLKSIEKLGNN